MVLAFEERDRRNTARALAQAAAARVIAAIFLCGVLDKKSKRRENKAETDQILHPPDLYREQHKYIILLQTLVQLRVDVTAGFPTVIDSSDAFLQLVKLLSVFKRFVGSLNALV